MKNLLRLPNSPSNPWMHHTQLLVLVNDKALEAITTLCYMSSLCFYYTSWTSKQDKMTSKLESLHCFLVHSNVQCPHASHISPSCQAERWCDLDFWEKILHNRADLSVCRQDTGGGWRRHLYQKWKLDREQVELPPCSCTAATPTQVYMHVCSDADQFIHEYKWIFVPDVMKYPPGVSQWPWHFTTKI